MKLTVETLEYSADTAAIMAEFGKPLSKIDVEVLKDDGFSAARGLARHCIKWMWLQWLLEGSVEEIRAKAKSFVDKGMAMQDKSSLFYMRPHADLYLLHCAIFGSSPGQLEKLAARVVDASGIAGQKPTDKGGDLYASAWCGMLKNWRKICVSSLAIFLQGTFFLEGFRVE